MYELLIFTGFRGGPRAGETLLPVADAFAAATGADLGSDVYETVDCILRKGLDGESDPYPAFSHLLCLAYSEEAAIRAAQRRILAGVEDGLAALLAGRPRRVIATRAFEQRREPSGRDPRRMYVPIRKSAALSLEAFRAHWRSHGPLILGAVPGVLGYIQFQSLDGLEANDDAWDGVAGFWFESLDAVLELGASQPETMAAIAADERAFLADAHLENYVMRPLAAR
jgi:hypothetical protein